MSQIHVRDKQGRGLPLINIRIATGGQSSDEAIFDILTDNEGNQGWPIPFWPNQHYTIHVNMRQANGATLRFDSRFGESTVDVAPGDHDVEVVLPHADGPSGSVSRLVGVDATAHRFVTEDGRRQFLRGATMFILYKRYLDGEDVTPLLGQLQALGCNMVRMFGMVTSFAHWHPQEYGDRYYDQIVPFMNLLAQYGIYGLWTACADTQQIMPSEAQALHHLLRTVDQLVLTQNALFSFVNEQGQHENGINRQAAYDAVMKDHRIGWLQFDTGSFGEDAPCEAPFGTHVVLHVRRAYPSHVKDCCVLDHPNRVNAPHLEVLLDEPDRYGEGGNMTLVQCRDSAATSFTSLGFVFHTSQGVQSAGPYSGRTLEMAQTIFPILRAF